MFEIGHSLRAARERQGLSYAEIEHATKIRAKYIRALEEEEFTVLPSDAYIRGFLRTYADYLGLDGDVYVEEYGSRFITSWRDELPPPPRKRRPHPRDRAVERRAVLLGLAGIAVLAALVFVAFRYGGGAPKTPGVGTTQQRQSAPVPELTLRGIGRGTYVEVRRGGPSGRVVLQATVARGGVQRLSGRSFTILVRRPRNVRVVFDGQAVRLGAGKNVRIRMYATRQGLTTRPSG
jgi:transcriptional regulator with XRE-family HTH domain